MAVSDKHPILAGIVSVLKQAAGPARRDLLIVLFTIMFVATFFAPRAVVTVATGDAGVLWYRFGGGVAPQPLNDGLHIIFPWNRIYSYYMRERNDTHSYKAITKDGITVDCQITLLYHLVRENLPLLHQQIGLDYVEVQLLPAIGAEVRRTIANYSVDSLYGAERHQIEEEILSDIVGAPDNGIAGKGNVQPTDLLFADEIHIRAVQLPEELSQAILEKARQQQLALGYTYRLDRERLEAQRKEVEAGGIAKFQQMVQQGISPTYLQWRGIEATLQLATSPNAKVVVIGGKDGLPLILNQAGAAARTSEQQNGATAGPGGSTGTTGRAPTSPSPRR